MRVMLRKKEWEKSKWKCDWLNISICKYQYMLYVHIYVLLKNKTSHPTIYVKYTTIATLSI